LQLYGYIDDIVAVIFKIKMAFSKDYYNSRIVKSWVCHF